MLDHGAEFTMLRRIWAASLDGVAVLDADERALMVNPAGCVLLGVEERDLVGSRPFGEWHRHRPDVAVLRRAADGRAQRLRISHVDIGAGRLGVVFRDLTEGEQDQRRLAAFATAASSMAYAGSLRETLDAICAELVRTVDLAGAQILLIDSDSLQMTLHGAAPSAKFGDDFSARLAVARARGAEFASLTSLRQGAPVVTPGRKALMLADERWTSLHDHLRGFEWDTFVSVPLNGRDAPIGALNIYCRVGYSPGYHDIRFFTAMADQVSVAVQHARLFADSKARTQHEERQRLARELHDSACQELFSINLHVRAAKFLLARLGAGSAGTASADSTGTASGVGAAVEPTLQDKLARHVETLGELAHAALEDMRSLIFELYPTVLHDEGLVAVTRQLVASLAAREGIDATVECTDDALAVEGAAALDGYHIIREALHNVVKHARADSVRVLVGSAGRDGRTLVIDVRDDGVGIAPEVTPGRLGLVSMRERAERHGGRFSVSAASPRGTVVRVEIPSCVEVLAPGRDGSAS